MNDGTFAKQLARCIEYGAGWRMPTHAELQTLYAPEYIDQWGAALEGVVFLMASFQGGPYWTTDINPSEPADSHLTVDFSQNQPPTTWAQDGSALGARCVKGP